MPSTVWHLRRVIRRCSRRAATIGTSCSGTAAAARVASACRVTATRCWRWPFRRTASCWPAAAARGRSTSGTSPRGGASGASTPSRGRSCRCRFHRTASRCSRHCGRNGCSAIRGWPATWDVHPRREAGRYPWPCGVETAVYSPDGAVIAVTTVNHDVEMWDAELDRPLVARTVAGLGKLSRLRSKRPNPGAGERQYGRGVPAAVAAPEGDLQRSSR